VQGLLAVTFVGTGIWKVATPIPELAAKMPWMGEVSPSFLHATAMFDTLGGVGVLLPSLTRIRPGLTVLHVLRGEAANTPFNFLLMALSLFVAWGRHRKAPIAPRA
jgi:hypothetical protein